MLNDNAKIRSEDIHKTQKGQAEQKAAGLKILTPKQMLHRLPIALAQVKTGNNSESYSMKLVKLFILCINKKKSLKKHKIT